MAISNSFINNTIVCHPDRIFCGGGGFGIKLKQEPPGSGSVVRLESNSFVSNTVITQGTFNTAQHFPNRGGAAVLYDSSTMSTGNTNIVKGNTFRRNHSIFGGRLKIGYSSPALNEIQNCTGNFFEENTATLAGGAIELKYLESAHGRNHFSENKFVQNRCLAGWGGGICFTWGNFGYPRERGTLLCVLLCGWTGYLVLPPCLHLPCSPTMNRNHPRRRRCGAS